MRNRMLEMLAATLSLSSIVVAAMAGNAVAGPFMVEKGPTLAPFGHVEFCLHTRVACAARTGVAVVDLSPNNSALLDEVNRSVNAEIVPKNDPSSVQDWQISPPAGDCNDYAVTKQHELVSNGLSTTAVRLAVAKMPDGEGHLVVVVKTSQGDEVLDNRTDDITRWDQTDLTWLKVESGSDPKLWRRL